MALAETLSTTITAIGDIVAPRQLQLERNGAIESIQPSGYEHMV